MDQIKYSLSEEEIDKIVEKALDKAVEKMYLEVGRSIIKRGLWVIGSAVVAIAIWLAGGGHFPK